MLVDHRAEPNARPLEPTEHVRERRVHNEPHLVLHAKFARKQSQVLDTRRIADIPAATHEDQLDGIGARTPVFRVLLKQCVERAELGRMIFLRPM